MDHAEYIGPLTELQGLTAMVKPDGTYELPLEQRTLLAQFDRLGSIHPSWKVDLSRQFLAQKKENWLYQELTKEGRLTSQGGGT